MQIKLPKDLPNELLYGRAGLLWACSFLNKNIGKDTISSNQMVRPSRPNIVIFGFLSPGKMAVTEFYVLFRDQL